MAGYNNKIRAKFFNRIWHPYLPRKVSAMQWLILTEGLPVGAWRERLGLPNNCQLCSIHTRESLHHAFLDCPEITRIWDLFRILRRKAGLPDSYRTWVDISRGLMTEAPGPSMEEELRWDTASAFSINSETPWDILRAQLLWAVWCQRVEIAFREDYFHLGIVLWHAWKNTIYYAMEAYKELFRHKRNEGKRQELISCFQLVWTENNIFGRMREGDIRWHLTPPKEFLPEELAAWTATPIRIHRNSPSPDVEADFAARPDFTQRVAYFLQNIANNFRPQPQDKGPSNPQPLDSQRNPTQGEGGSWSNAPWERPNSDYADGAADPFVADADTDLLHAGEETLSDIRTQTSPTYDRPETSSTRDGTQSHRIGLSHKRKPPQLTEERPLQEGRRERDRCVSRRKRKCRRILRPTLHPLQKPTSTLVSPRSSLLDSPYTGNGEQQPSQEGTNLKKTKPKSRGKTRCRFGPRKQGSTNCLHGDAEFHHSPIRFFEHRKDLRPPSPIECRIQSSPLPTANLVRQTAPSLSTSNPCPPIFPAPDRVTLTPPFNCLGNPLDCYKASASKAPEPDPYRFIHAKLGLTAEEFNQRVSNDIDEFLTEIESNRRQELLEQMPYKRVLSKEDCIRMLARQNISTLLPSGGCGGGRPISVLLALISILTGITTTSIFSMHTIELQSCTPSHGFSWVFVLTFGLTPPADLSCRGHLASCLTWVPPSLYNRAC